MSRPPWVYPSKRRLDAIDEVSAPFAFSLSKHHKPDSISAPDPPPPSPTVHQLLVTLCDSKPPIWRRLRVPSHYTLFRLHGVLQELFEWHELHLHKFSTRETSWEEEEGDRCFLSGNCHGAGDPHEEGEREGAKDEETALLSDVLGEVGRVWYYLYDFGDNWRHSVLVEAITPAATCPTSRLCNWADAWLMEGERQGPPEDAGGMGFFNEVVEAHSMRVGFHGEYAADWLRWAEKALGHRFAPAECDVERLRDRLRSQFFVYELHVSLKGSLPHVWRRVCVPATWTLAQLHVLMQALFNWRDQHVHQFTRGARRMRLAFSRVGTLDPDDSVVGAENEEDVTLGEFAPRKGDSFEYAYDSSDAWTHRLFVERVLPKRYLSHRHYPYLCGGANSGPPEGCGGIARYNAAVRGLEHTGPRTAEQERWLVQMRESLGHALSPREFAIGDIRKRFRTEEFQDAINRDWKLKRPPPTASTPRTDTTAASSSGGTPPGMSQADSDVESLDV